MTSLRHRLLEDMQLRQLSPFTQRAYVASIAQFARHMGRSPADVGPAELRAYQLYLTTERGLAPSSVGVAVSALRFLYRVTLRRRWPVDEVLPLPKKPRPLPVVLSPEEVVQFLDGVKRPLHRAQADIVGFNSARRAEMPGRFVFLEKLPLHRAQANVVSFNSA